MSGNTFYDFFDAEANDGYVCDDDMSFLDAKPTKLITAEIKERREWNKKFERIYRHYMDPKKVKHPDVTSRKELLRQRLVAPKLATGNVTTRTRAGEPRAGRMYPPPSQLRTWDSLVGSVNNYEIKESKNTMLSYEYEVFKGMLISGRTECRSGDGEETHVLKGLEFLVCAKIVSSIQKRHGAIGKPDFLLKKNAKKISMIAESESTHNLLMPVRADELLRKYKVAYDCVVKNCGIRTREWSHIAHPLAQLLGYMVDNKRRYGALTSATRTYFVFVSDDGPDTKVHVSEPYFVGEKDYLRAWAYVHSLGSGQVDTYQPPSLGPRKWLRTDTSHPTPQPKDASPKTTNNKRGRRGGSGRKDGRTSKKPKTRAALRLPQVDFQELVVGDALRSGRNGSVFKVDWRGDEYALKQFDVRKDGEAGFEKELAAYARTRNAWGKLVPEPFFLSETPSGGVMLLGLQLGRPVEHDDPNMEELSLQWETALETLESEYGIRHNDTEGRDAIVVKDNAHDQVVVIDFEDWDDLRCADI